MKTAAPDFTAVQATDGLGNVRTITRPPVIIENDDEVTAPIYRAVRVLCLDNPVYQVENLALGRLAQLVYTLLTHGLSEEEIVNRLLGRSSGA